VRFLIRRTGIGADLVDLVVNEAGADPRRACLLFGQTLKALRRAGHPVDSVPRQRWVELFRALGQRPALWEARWRLAVALAAAPDSPLADAVSALGLDRPAGDWQAAVADAVASARPDHDDGDADKRVRFHMGRVMQPLRGLVPGREVRACVEDALKAGGAG